MAQTNYSTLYTFGRQEEHDMAYFHSYRSIAPIVGLNRNVYYLHLALHKLSIGHVSYNCTLSGRIGNNHVVVKTLLKLTPTN